MQTWKKFLLISLLIIAVVGALIGFIITKSGLGDVKILTNINIFTLIVLLLLLIAVTCGIFDAYETYESKQQLGDSKFGVKMQKINIFIASIVFLALVTLFEFGVFIESADINILLICFITLTLTLIFIIHSYIDNGFNENGLLHWGIFHSWADMQSYDISNDNLLKIIVINNFFTFEYSYIIKFNFYEKDKDEIEEFLSQVLSSMKNLESNSSKI